MKSKYEVNASDLNFQGIFVRANILQNLDFIKNGAVVGSFIYNSYISPTKTIIEGKEIQLLPIELGWTGGYRQSIKDIFSFDLYLEGNFGNFIRATNKTITKFSMVFGGGGGITIPLQKNIFNIGMNIYFTVPVSFLDEYDNYFKDDITPKYEIFIGIVFPR